MDAVIYSLADPRNGQIRYVGKTTESGFAHRLKCHVTDLNGKKSYKCNWMRSLIKLHLVPRMEPLEVIKNSNDMDWQESERFWIGYLKFLGCKLTNGDCGGRSGKKVSEATRVKMSEAQKGRKQSEETKAKISRANAGRIRSPEHKAKLSASLNGRKSWCAGKKMPAWIREKLSLAAKRRKRNPCSEETKAKIGLANRGKLRTPEHRRKISATLMGNIPWNKGVALSESHRANLSKSHKGLTPWNKGLKLSQ